MKVLIQHPERRTTQVIVVSSAMGFVAAIQPAECAELELPEGDTLSLAVMDGASIEAPAPDAEPDDLTPEDEQELADAFASLDSEPHGEDGQG